jgi:hypothetical protein
MQGRAAAVKMTLERYGSWSISRDRMLLSIGTQRGAFCTAITARPNQAHLPCGPPEEASRAASAGLNRGSRPAAITPGDAGGRATPAISTDEETPTTTCAKDRRSPALWDGVDAGDDDGSTVAA